MRFSIPTNTLKRLSTVLSLSAPQHLNAIRLEHLNGNTLAIVTNQQVAAIELIAPTDQPNGHCYLKPQDWQPDQVLEIDVMPEFALATDDCCYWWDDPDTPLSDWQSWIAPVAVASSGVMVWDTYQMMTLWQSSPTGQVVFPQFIDADKPVCVRDGDWMGLFLPSDEKVKEAAVLPEWVG